MLTSVPNLPGTGYFHYVTLAGAKVLVRLRPGCRSILIWIRNESDTGLMGNDEPGAGWVADIALAEADGLRGIFFILDRTWGKSNSTQSPGAGGVADVTLAEAEVLARLRQGLVQRRPPPVRVPSRLLHNNALC